MNSKIKNENILCAAIWYKEINPRAYHRPINTPGGVVLCGHRHPHIISQVKSLLDKPHYKLGKYVNGFLTNKNRFVDRKEAAKIWLLNGNKLNYNDELLFSEDLY